MQEPMLYLGQSIAATWRFPHRAGRVSTSCATEKKHGLPPFFRRGTALERYTLGEGFSSNRA